MGASSGEGANCQINLERLAEVMERMQRGDRIPLDPAWLETQVPLSDAERGRLKGMFARNRQLDPPLNCMAPTIPSCERAPIQSHSMQRGGPLALLAEGHKVLVLRYAQSVVEKADTYMKLTPIRQATVFPGLCDQHDALLFEPIERHTLREPTLEQTFLLAFRAVLRTLYVARKMARQREADLSSVLERSPPSGTLEMFVASLLRIELVIPRLTFVVEEFSRWHRERVHDLPTITQTDLPKLPFAISCYIEPRFDEDGRPIQYSGELRPFIVLNVVPAQDGTMVAVSFLEEHRQALDTLLAPLKVQKSWRNYADLIWQIALRYSDNLVVDPKVWRSLSKERRNHIIEFADETRDGGFVPMLPSIISLYEDTHGI